MMHCLMALCGRGTCFYEDYVTLYMICTLALMSLLCSRYFMRWVGMARRANSTKVMSEILMLEYAGLIELDVTYGVAQAVSDSAGPFFFLFLSSFASQKARARSCYFRVSYMFQ